MLKVKIKNIIIILLLLVISSVNTATAQKLPLTGKVITIDPGHGGRDPGTIYQNILEKNLNLEISLKLEKELLKQGATVYMIRRTDIDLSSIYDSNKKRGDLYRRLLLIKEHKSDLYISVHINWYENSRYKGAEVLYNSINKNNKILAEEIMDQFKGVLNSDRNIHTTDLYLYKNTTIPGVLVECGYLSNYQERKLLVDEEYQKNIAKALTNGIINYAKTTNGLDY